MRESSVAKEWIDRGIAKGRKEGRAETLRANIRTTLATRFGTVPAELLRRIDAATDVARLDRAFEQALTVERPEDLRL